VIIIFAIGLTISLLTCLAILISVTITSPRLSNQQQVELQTQQGQQGQLEHQEYDILYEEVERTTHHGHIELQDYDNLYEEVQSNLNFESERLEARSGPQAQSYRRCEANNAQSGPQLDSLNCERHYRNFSAMNRNLDSRFSEDFYMYTLATNSI